MTTQLRTIVVIFGLIAAIVAATLAVLNRARAAEEIIPLLEITGTAREQGA
jgi:hypothetical protein